MANNGRTHNRILYDECYTEVQSADSVVPGEYHMFPMYYENTNRTNCENGCMTFSQMRNNISENISSRVDIESDLRGQNSKLSDCPSKKHQPVQDKALPVCELPPEIFRVVELDKTAPSNPTFGTPGFSTCISKK